MRTMMRKGRRRGEVSMQMTADELLSLAVNVCQNGWSLDECRVEAEGVSINLPTDVLLQIYELVLETNRMETVRWAVRTRPCLD